VVGIIGRKVPAPMAERHTCAPAWRGSNAMSLSALLRNVDLTLECKSCGHLIIKKGDWFITASTFKCDQCKGEVRLTYSDKVALFDKHAHLA
jgi:Zn finger protein HypA/HybF involved in hydrogenase expression